MRDKRKQIAMAGAFWLALLMAASTVIDGFGAPAADLRLIEAVRNQDL